MIPMDDDNNNEESFSPNDLVVSRGGTSWGYDSFMERGEGPLAMNTSRDSLGHDPTTRAFQDATGREGSIRVDPVVGVVHKNTAFHSKYSEPIEPSQGEGKTIRFADIIATDMDEMDETLPQDCQWQESSLVETSDDDDQANDESSTRSDGSEHENKRIRQQLLYAVSGAGFMAFLVWGGKKVIDIFQKRVEEEEEDRVGGADVWGNNPIAEHLQIKDTAKGFFVNQGNKTSAPSTVGGTLNM